jgi:hypothetical protein
LSIFCFDLNAQNKAVLNESILDAALLYSDSSLEVSYNKEICSPSIGFDQEVLSMSFKNLTSENLRVSWHFQLYYNGLCKTCDYPNEYSFELLLLPNEMLSGDCFVADQRLVVFSKFVDSGYKGNAQLTGVNLGNLVIQK